MTLNVAVPSALKIGGKGDLYRNWTKMKLTVVI